MSLTKASYSLISGAPINVLDYGAYNDGTNPAATRAAIQAVFDLAYKSAADNYAAIRAGQLNAISIVFPPGKYAVDAALILGEVGKTVMFVNIYMDGACIESSYAGASPALTLQYPYNCVFNGLNVFTNQAVTAIKINNSKGCAYYNTKASSAGFAAIHLVGMQFNNTWENISLNQNIGGGGSTWCWYWDCDPANIIAPAIFAAGPINKFTGLFMANGINSMYWNYAQDVSINVCEHEGFASATGVGVAQFYNCEELTISNWYQEAFPNPANSLYFGSCSFVKLSNLRSGSYYHYTKFKDCSNVSIENYYIGPIKYEGTNTDFDFVNCKFFTASVRTILQQDSSGVFKRLQMRNILIRNQTDTTDVGQIPLLTTGSLNQSSNWLQNPRCVTALGNVTATYCTAINDASYQDVSPLGFIETVVEVTSTTGFPRLIPNIDTANLAGAKTSKAVVLTAWRVANLPAGFTTGSGTSGTTKSNKFYGDVNLQIDDWMLSWSIVDFDSADTNLTLVWNYAAIPSIGTKFLFGGAIVYGGSDIRVPIV